MMRSLVMDSIFFFFFLEILSKSAQNFLGLKSYIFQLVVESQFLYNNIKFNNTALELQPNENILECCLY